MLCVLLGSIVVCVKHTHPCLWLAALRPVPPDPPFGIGRSKRPSTASAAGFIVSGHHAHAPVNGQ
jgi:hypothetical protein